MTAAREYDPASGETDAQTTDAFPDKQKWIPTTSPLHVRSLERQYFLPRNESGYEKPNHPQPRTGLYETAALDIVQS
jgi:hypothetical protein